MGTARIKLLLMLTIVLICQESVSALRAPGVHLEEESYLTGRDLQQIGDMHDASPYIESEQIEERELQEEGAEEENEEEKEESAAGSLGQADDEEDYIEGVEEDYEEEAEQERERRFEDEQNLDLEREAEEQEEDEGEQGYPDQEELEKLEEEEYLKQKEKSEEEEQRGGSQSSEKGKKGIEIGGREGSSAQETLAKFSGNGTNNGTAGTKTQPYDEEIERAINAHLGGSTTTTSAAGKAQASGVSDQEALEAEEEYLTEIGDKKEAGRAGSQDQSHKEFEDFTQLSNASTETVGKGSSDTLEENFLKTSNLSVAAAPESLTQKNSSLMAQGAILGTTIGSMVKENSSSIAGVVGLLIAGAAGIGVACAGISLWRRFRNRRVPSKGLPRIIEIGALSSRKQKSPSYARVHERNQDHLGSSGATWRDDDSGWDGNGGERDYNALSPHVKHKKAWDWDADW